eukprot:15839241-Heterocapsa_arctica.AAC.1
MVHGSIVLLLWDQQAPRERNDHVEEVLGMFRKAAKTRERACGHDAPLFACDECKRARAVIDPEPVDPYAEPPIDANGDPVRPEQLENPYAEDTPPARTANGNTKQGDDAWGRYRRQVLAQTGPQAKAAQESADAGNQRVD